MVCVKRKIRAKVRIFRELSEKSAKKAEKGRPISHKAASPFRQDTALARAQVLRQFCCPW